MLTKQIDRALVSDRVFERLLTEIISGEYELGAKLPTQRALAADLGVTMTSLREALKRLEQMGLIEVRHGDAMRVRNWREHGGLDVITHLLFRSGTLDWSILGNLFEVRNLVLKEIASLASRRRTDEQVIRLRELAAEFAAASDAATAQEVDFVFFTEMTQAAGNIVFVLILNSIRALYFQYSHLLPLAERSHELEPYYAQLADAIGEGEADRAAEIAAELAELQWKRVASLFRASGL